MYENIKNNLFQYLSVLFILGLFITNIENCFFGDTVQLGSKHASYYLECNFSHLLLPISIDSGHIPSFGMYIAFVWKIFGRNLIVSHLAILPFTLGIIWQLGKIVNYYFNKEHAGLVVFLLMLDPSLLSQITLISPDVPLVFFFLLAWNSLLKNKKEVLMVAVFFLFLTSMRGMMISVCLLIIDILYNLNYKESIKNVFVVLVKRSMIYLPALLLFISFSTYHYLETGWIGFHEDSPWAECFERPDFKGFLLNLGVLGWRILDFGRIGIWLVFSILFLKYRKEIFRDKQTLSLLFIFLCFLVILPANMVWAKNLLGHRYLIPVYLTFAIFVAKILFSLCINLRLKRILIIVWFVSLVSGNFWVYPDKISQGWDSTLAHLPYYDLRKQAINYIEEQNIDFNRVQSFFPNTALIDNIDLNGDTRNFENYSKGAEYVFYSNAYNISDEIYDAITNDYKLVKEFKKSTVFIKIYKRSAY